MREDHLDYCLGYYLLLISLNNSKLKYDRRNIALRRLCDDKKLITVDAKGKMTLTLAGSAAADVVSTLLVGDNLLDTLG